MASVLATLISPSAKLEIVIGSVNLVRVVVLAVKSDELSAEGSESVPAAPA